MLAHGLSQRSLKMKQWLLHLITNHLRQAITRLSNNWLKMLVLDMQSIMSPQMMDTTWAFSRLRMLRFKLECINPLCSSSMVWWIHLTHGFQVILQSHQLSEWQQLVSMSTLVTTEATVSQTATLTWTQRKMPKSSTISVLLNLVCMMFLLKLTKWEISGNDKITYVGHSQGTTQMFYALAHN